MPVNYANDYWASTYLNQSVYIHTVGHIKQLFLFGYQVYITYTKIYSE